MKPSPISIRANRGASIYLVLACVSTIVLLIYGSFQLMRLFVASQELRNGVDAAALNVSKRAVEIKVPPSEGYDDCSDSTGNTSLTSINRVWGKAFLINANVEAMTADGQGTDMATANGNTAYQYAQQTNDTLYSALTAKSTLGQIFNDMGHKRSVKVLGSEAPMEASVDGEWTTSLVDRGSESNLSFNPNQLPGTTGSQLYGIGPYVQGYRPFQINNRTYYLVPFRQNEMPHLISGQYFGTNRSDTNPIPGVTNALPNAYSGTGLTPNGTNASLSAVAYAVANPQRQYALSIPHSFVSIFISNTAKWYVNAKMVNQTAYQLGEQTQWGVKNYKLPNGGKLNGYASLGNEYGGGGGAQSVSVYQALMSLPADYQQSLAKLLQRINEINANYTAVNLTTLLQNQPVVAAVNQYLIYPVYQTSDATNPQIKISPATTTASGWLALQSRPEGTQKLLTNSDTLRDTPNYCWQVITGGNPQGGTHWTEVTGDTQWQPGTGYNQCLGELRIDHITKCYFVPP